MFLDILDPFLDQKIIQNYLEIIFSLKEFTKKKFQLKIPNFSKSDVCATWWPNSYKIFLTCGQFRNTQRYQKYDQLVQAFFRVSYMFRPTVHCSKRYIYDTKYENLRFAVKSKKGVVTLILFYLRNAVLS